MRSGSHGNDWGGDSVNVAFVLFDSHSGISIWIVCSELDLNFFLLLLSGLSCWFWDFRRRFFFISLSDLIIESLRRFCDKLICVDLSLFSVSKFHRFYWWYIPKEVVLWSDLVSTCNALGRTLLDFTWVFCTNESFWNFFTFSLYFFSKLCFFIFE